ncbi:Ldh family oxidoreductase [Bradyrhizobium sp. SEMIA]|uniref:Ldh family oxidoreductase n=1 Tax=Bradyrhizobium sp. SEMIA TaxID=2597515 RepID=UPI0018A3496D|nr:Ldh family oxidoreductase [Bradyrhizobium sp. SEMIA]QOG21076.1 Ldh family oxidoreductase [Bradyrhizobium sp. SEMIA]
MNVQTGTVDVSLEALKGLLARIFERNGCSSVTASILAANCTGAEAAGSFSHGVFRVDGYISSLRSGWVDGAAVPEIYSKAPAYIFANAKNGFAQVALHAARDAFVQRIRNNGVALLSIRGSHHFSALWPDVTPFAQQGLIAISMVNSFCCSIPVGAKKPLLGTNPFAFAAPIRGEAPLVFDFATTSMAHGDVQLAAHEGRALPPGVGVDSSGEPTTDPDKILDGGALVPFGGHKGSAISLMVELMVAGLTGGKFSTEVDWSAHPGAQTPHTGQIIIGIDPAFSEAGGFSDRSSQFIALLRDAGMEGYPGLRRWRTQSKGSVTISSAMFNRLTEYATEVK